MDKNKVLIILIILFLGLVTYILLKNCNDSYHIEHMTNTWPPDHELVGEPYGVLAGIWKGDTLIHKIEYGVSDIVNHTPMKWDMHCRIGSVTKTFTCTIILMLVDQGLISLDHEARQYLPFIPQGITVRQLGNMTSGLYNYSLDEQFNNTLDRSPLTVWNHKELAMNGIRHPRLFPPGKGWSYSNTNTVLLGLIAEKVTGKTLNDLYQEMIFKRLGLKNTSLPSSNDNTLPKPYSHGYMIGYNNEKNNVTRIIRDVTNDNSSWTWAAGGIISTIDDLKIYIKALGKGTLLGPKAKELRDNSFIELGLMDYGFGLFRMNNEWYGHNGQIPGYQTFAVYSPVKDITIVIMCNLFADSKGAEPADVIGKKIIDFIVKNNI